MDGKAKIKRRLHSGLLAAMALTLSACGGGGGDGSTAGTPSTPGPTPTPPINNSCSVSSRQSWADAQIREWYLFPETLPASVDPGAYPDVESYIDALTATARAQRRDRYFTYLTSIASENAYYSSGTTAGMGLRLTLDSSGTRIFVVEAFENGPGLAAGIDRGAEITAIGTSTANLRSVSSIIAAEGVQGIVNALGPDTDGTTRTLRISDASGIRSVSITKSAFDILPVSTRYGAKVIDDGGRKVGYVNLRNFIQPAEPALADAFAQFRAQGITDVIVDLRYNGGGLISVAETLGNLLGGGRSPSDVFARVEYRPEKSSRNETITFVPRSESVTPVRIAFIGAGGTASASELVINALIPYFDTNLGLIGTNTYGKPVGQVALDKPECDDRLRVVALSIRNSANMGDYYDGLAGTVKASCRSTDDLAHAMGDASETSTRQALDFLAGRSCTPIAATTVTTQSAKAPEGKQQLLTPARPKVQQRDVPGLF